MAVLCQCVFSATVGKSKKCFAGCRDRALLNPQNWNCLRKAGMNTLSILLLSSTQYVGSSGEAYHLYSGGCRFEFELGQRLICSISLFSSVTPDKPRGNTSTRPQRLSSTPHRFKGAYSSMHATWPAHCAALYSPKDCYAEYKFTYCYLFALISKYSPQNPHYMFFP
jgi:hypothetical protein